MTSTAGLVKVPDRVPQSEANRQQGYSRDGAVAGAISAAAFTAIHHLTISNIWGALIPMMIAGALCGLCIAWTYSRLVRRRTVVTWAIFNAAHLAMIAGLAAASLLIFEPVTTMAAVIASAGPVDDLIAKALPLTLVFILSSTGLIGLALARERSDYWRLLLSVTTLTVLLGLNVSVIGLVDMSGNSSRPVVMFFALIVLLDAVYAAVLAGCRWSELTDPA